MHLHERVREASMKNKLETRFAWAFAKVIGCLLCLWVWCGAEAVAEEKPCQLSGRVQTASGNKAIAGLGVELLELNLHAITDQDGRFIFPALDPGKYRLMIRHPDYLPGPFVVTCPSVQEIVLNANSAPRLLERMTVTATPWAADHQELAATLQVVESERIKARSGASMAQAVAALPGLRTVVTGDAAAVPLIRGQGNERIRVLNDGISHDFYQFSRRHMPNLEAYDASCIEVVSGPACVLYGPQAGSGVVNVVSRLPRGDSGNGRFFSGSTLMGYADGNESTVFHTQIQGSQGGLSGQASITRRRAGDTSTPDIQLPNTGYNQDSVSLQAALRSRTGLEGTVLYRNWQNELGFYIPAQPDFHLALRNELGGLAFTIPSGLGKWEFSAHLAQNSRRAYPMGIKQGAKVDLELDSQVYRLSWLHEDLAFFRHGVLRVEHSRQENESLGPVTLLPDYQTKTWSLMAFEEFRLLKARAADRLVFHAGLRFDRRELATPAEFYRTYQALTGALGLVWRFKHGVSAGLSLSRGWRNPSEFELFANGAHDGVQLYEKGNPDLDEETNFNSELVVRMENERLSASLALFNNDFSDYIYLCLTGEQQDGLAVSTFAQADAWVRGIEGRATLFLTPQLNLTVQGEALRTQNKQTGTRLPFSPPDRASMELVLRDFFRYRHWENPVVTLRAVWTGRGRIAGADEPFPMNTDSYMLFELGAGVNRKFGDNSLQLDLWVGNLLNRRYRDFLDTYKQIADSAGRNVRLTVAYRY